MYQKLKFFNILKNILTIIYLKIFNHEAPPEILKFFDSLSKVSMASIFAIIFTFSFNAIAGRFAGPDEYGIYQVIQAIVTFIYIPMTFGITTAFLNFNAKETTIDKHTAIFSNTFILVSVLVLVSSIIYIIFSTTFSKIFSVSTEIFLFALVFAIIYSFYSLMNNTLTSLHKMGVYASYQILTGFLMFSILLLLFCLGYISFKSMMISISIAYLVTIFIIFFTHLKYLKFEFVPTLSKKLITYGFYATLGGLACSFYNNIDLIFINMFLDSTNAGIYSVYKYSSIGLGLVLFGIFNTVFFPWVSKRKNKMDVFKGVNNLLPYGLIFGVPLAFLSEFLIFWIYGSEYPFNFFLAILFSLAFFLMIVNNIYVWIMSSIGTQGIQISSISSILLALCNILMNFILIPSLGIMGGIISLIISYIIAISFIFYKRDVIKFYNKLE